MNKQEAESLAATLNANGVQPWQDDKNELDHCHLVSKNYDPDGDARYLVRWHDTFDRWEAGV
jgi:hypothetical protein